MGKANHDGFLLVPSSGGFMVFYCVVSLLVQWDGQVGQKQDYLEKQKREKEEARL